METTALPDAILLERWRSGNVEAGEELFERHIDGVTRFFRNKVATGVEDLVQDTFLGLVEGRDRVRETSSTRSYLFAIAHNVLRTHLKGIGHDRVTDRGYSSIIDIMPNLSTLVSQQRERDLLLRGLRRLPLLDQVILELAFWEGLSATEIGEIVGASPSSIRGRLFRGRQRLKQELADLASSKELLDSTLDGFERWVADIRAELAVS